MYEYIKKYLLKEQQHLTSLLISHASTGRFSPNFPKRCLKDKRTAIKIERCAEKKTKKSLKKPYWGGGGGLWADMANP